MEVELPYDPLCSSLSVGWRKGNLGRHKLCPKNSRIILKSIIQQGWGTSKSGEALRILGVTPKAGEKGVVQK